MMTSLSLHSSGILALVKILLKRIVSQKEPSSPRLFQASMGPTPSSCPSGSLALKREEKYSSHIFLISPEPPRAATHSDDVRRLKGILGPSPPASGKQSHLAEPDPSNLATTAVDSIEPLVSDGNLRSCFLGRGGLGRSSGTRRDGRVATFRRIRVGSWNVGSLTGKLLELVDALERCKVDIAYFQETKWKGTSNREANGYKLWYSGSLTVRNEVGVILKAGLKDKVVHVNRCGDRIISLTLVIDGETVNGVPDEPTTDPRRRFERAYRSSDGGIRSKLAFQEERPSSDYLSERGCCTQIDYLLVRRGDLKACKDCRVFPREACSSQHSLLALDILFKSVQHKREGSALPRILWKNLMGDATEAFRSRVAEGISTRVEALAACDADTMWNTLASIIKDAAKDTLGVAIGTSKTHTARRESWWLCEEVQSIVAVKQARFRELLSCREGNEE
ncbi:craniofacial development protein 2-like protein [Tanacetum coccineum]